MKRKELVLLAVDLIEEALEKPNQTIILEERIRKPIQEPGMKEITDDELDKSREYTLSSIEDLSKTPIYQSNLKETTFKHNTRQIIYNNDSKIIFKEEK